MTDQTPTTEDDTAPPEATSTPPSTREMERRWGKGVLGPGFVFLPSALVRGQSRLKIDATELTVLIHLLDHWWAASEMPFPSKRRLSERMGVSEKTIQRAMARLEALGLVKRVARHFAAGGQASNFYDLSGLVERVQEIARDMMEARKEAQETRRKAERPGLKRRGKPAKKSEAQA